LFLSSTSSILDRKGKVNNMDNRETPPDYKDKFQLIFVGMFWSDDPKYETWTEGRIEIRTWDDVHCNDEIRFCTKKTDEWWANDYENEKGRTG